MSEAKGVIRGEMLAAGQALPYCEPERAVVSRSGDACVVALTDQWYISYGEVEWRDATRCVVTVLASFGPSSESPLRSAGRSGGTPPVARMCSLWFGPCGRIRN